MLPSIAPKEQVQSASLTNRLLTHQHQLLNFLFHSQYDIIYLTFEQKHAVYLERKENKDIRTQRLDEMRRHYLAMSEKLHIRVLRFDIDLDKDVYRLEALWEALQIPYFHRYYFQSFLYTAFYKNVQALLINEEKMCRSETHIYYAITRAITAREACLRNLKIKLSQLTAQDIYEYLHVTKAKASFLQRKFEKERYEIQGYKVQHLSDGDKQPTVWKTKLELFFECYSHLKKLTYYAIELILKWRQYIQSLTHDQRKQREHLTFYYVEDNYLLKVLTDLGFAKVSVLSNFFEFAMRNDPFMLKCILSFEAKQNRIVDDQLLKQLIFPDEQEYYEMMTKLDILAKEYHSNIQKRRVYDLARNSHKSMSRFDPNNAESPIKQMVGRANQFLKDFSDRQKAKSMARFNNKPLSPIKQYEVQYAANTTNLISPDKNSPQVTRKNPFQLKDGKHSKSFRVIEFKDRRKIDVLASTSAKEVFNTPAPSTINKSLVLDSPKKSLLNETMRDAPATAGGTSIELNTPSPVKTDPKTEQAKRASNHSIDLIDSETLNRLKEEVVKRIKQTMTNKAVNLSGNTQDPLQSIIQDQLSSATRNIFPYQPKKQETKQLSLITLSIKEQSVKSQLTRIFKRYPQPYAQLQLPQEQLEQLLINGLYCFIVQAVIGSETIGYAFCGLDAKNTEFKILKVHHIMSYNIGYLQQLILRVTEFLWKYENSFEVEYTMLVASGNAQLVQFANDMNKKMEHNCLVISKQAYSTLTETRYIFKRKFKNVNYIPNRYPGKFHLDLRMLLSREQLIDSTPHNKEFVPEDSMYEYLLAEAVRRYTTSDDVILLKERSPWRGKLKYVLDMVLKLESGDLRAPETSVLEMERMTDINKTLKQLKQKLLELGDSKRQNRVSLLRTSLTMQFSHKMQQATLEGQHYYRIALTEKLSMVKTDRCSGYILNSHDRPESLMFMPAGEYLNDQQDRYSGSLLIYLTKQINEFGLQVTEAEHLWVPMLRVPGQFAERDQVYATTTALSQFAMLKKNLYYSEQLEWFCNVSLQNGLQLEQQARDLTIRRPYILAVLSNNTPLYAKCIH